MYGSSLSSNLNSSGSVILLVRSARIRCSFFRSKSNSMGSFNKVLPKEILVALARDPRWRVRNGIVRKHKLAPEVFEMLDFDCEDHIRKGSRNHPMNPKNQ
jgi:hypothetical protein